MTTNFGGVDVVPLLGAIARCHCSALSLRGEGDDQLWRSTWCHCWVPLVGGAFFLYIDNTKIGFCYLGSMLV